MSESNKDENINKEDNKSASEDKTKEEKTEVTIEEKLKSSEEKLLRSLADSENQRRRFDKEVKELLNSEGLILHEKCCQF